MKTTRSSIIRSKMTLFIGMTLVKESRVVVELNVIPISNRWIGIRYSPLLSSLIPLQETRRRFRPSNEGYNGKEIKRNESERPWVH